MRIKFITPELHAELTAIFNDHPGLTLQNVGYQYLHPDILKTEPALRVAEILKEHVVGFVRFFNFRRTKAGEIELRFDYDWGEEDNGLHFVGVGYVTLDQLRDGFPEGASQC